MDLSLIFRRLRFAAEEPLKGWTRMALKRREVRPRSVSSTLRDARIVAVMVVRDEAPRLPFLFDYHAALGVEHFIVIDNGSTDGLDEVLATRPDVSVFSALGRYGSARYGNDWANVVLNTHCRGKWILFVDADEFLVYDGAEHLGLGVVCDGLERRGRRTLSVVLLDMYSERPAGQNVIGTGEDPRQLCPLYDSQGYLFSADKASRTYWIKGGVRGRVFFDDPRDSPALNKTPLVHWRRGYLFLKSTHQLWPSRLNESGEKPRGALLHFKFTSIAAEKMIDPRTRQEHTAEYSAYDDVLTATMVGEATSRYQSSQSLVEDGLMEPLAQ